MTMPMEKPLLRAETLAARGAVGSEAAVRFADRLAVFGARLAREHGALVASAYWAIGDEVVTLPLLRALHAAGVAVALPLTGRRGTPLVFRGWRPGAPMVAGRMNIPEPGLEAPILVPDLLFVPLAAFDRRGHRIGYGAGFYDRTLAGLRATRAVLAVGVGYAAQEVGRVPNEAHDQPVDLVLTERELIRCVADR